MDLEQWEPGDDAPVEISFTDWLYAGTTLGVTIGVLYLAWLRLA